MDSYRRIPKAIFVAVKCHLYSIRVGEKKNKEVINKDKTEIKWETRLGVYM